MEWKTTRLEKPSKYKEVVLIVDATGFYGVNLAYFLTGSGFVDIHTHMPLIATHWCAIPEIPANKDHGTGVVCGLCGKIITGNTTEIGILLDKICHKTCMDKVYTPDSIEEQLTHYPPIKEGEDNAQCAAIKQNTP